MHEEIITFTGIKDGINIRINENADYSAIKNVFTEKAEIIADFIRDTDARVVFSGQAVTEGLQSELIAILESEYNLTVLRDPDSDGGAPRRTEAGYPQSADNEAAAYIYDTNAGKPPAEAPEQPGGRRDGDAAGRNANEYPRANGFEEKTLFYKSGLRSGQSITYEGSVVIFGDANPGSTITAGGSVIVQGALKGSVHAGYRGNMDAYVSAMKLLPTLLRICDIITYIPEDRKSKDLSVPSYAFIQGGQIFIAPLV